MAEYKSQSTKEKLDINPQWENRLREALYQASCPSAQDLGEFQLGMVEPSAAGQISLHLECCPHCTQELAQLDDFLVQTEPVKRPLVKNSSKIQTIVARLVEAISGIHELPATRDGGIQVRGSSIPPDEYSYEADGVEINFEITRNPAELQLWTVEGEIDTGDDEDSQWQVEVWRTDLDEPIQTQRAEIDPLEMSIEGLEAGKYSLIFSDGVTREIHIPDLQIG